MASSKASDLEKNNELFAVDVLRATKLHTEFNVIRLARECYQGHKFTDSRIKPLLDMMVKIFAVKMLMKESEGLYETGFFSKGSKALLTESFKQLLVQLRPHMISLVEGHPLFDTMFSTIGNKWGDIYEAQLDFAKNSRLNKHTVPHYYHSLMKPVMTTYKAKL